MKLTKLLALKICAELWERLARNTSEAKSNFPKWAKYGRMKNDCPCCEWMLQHNRRITGSCPECPLHSLWPNSCMWVGTPYRAWYAEVEGKASRRKYALIIARAARKEIKKIDARK